MDVSNQARLFVCILNVFCVAQMLVYAWWIHALYKENGTIRNTHARTPARTHCG